MARSPVGRFDIDVVPSLCEAEWLWRSFEADAVATPYQRYDWVKLWQRHVLPASGSEIMTVFVRLGREIVAILPCEMRKRGGLRIATIVGANHVNFQMPLASDRFAASKAQIGELLTRIGAAFNADAIKLEHQPRSWGQAANPLGGVMIDRDNNSAFVMDLDADFEVVSRSRRSARSLQQIRRKRRNLEAFAGRVEFKRADNSDSCARVINAANRQRAVRRRTSGIPSFFDVDGGVEFVRAAAEKGLGQPDGDCTLAVHYLEAGGSIVAAYFGGSFRGAYSCFLNSFDSDFQKFSPGDIILHDLIEHLCRKGLRQLDLGVGDEHYKRVWCDEVPLFATTIPVTLMGSLYRSGQRPLLMAKRSIKQNEFLLNRWRAARRLTA